MYHRLCSSLDIALLIENRLIVLWALIENRLIVLWEDDGLLIENRLIVLWALPWCFVDSLTAQL